MEADSAETTRTAVRTYVPAYQKDRWQEHADRLDMSMSEFVRMMVQSGRRGFLEAEENAATDTDASENESSSGPGDVDAAVIAALSEHEYLAWDDLVDAVIGDVEEQIENTLQQLQSENRVQYSGRQGGYTLIDE